MVISCRKKYGITNTYIRIFTDSNREEIEKKLVPLFKNLSDFKIFVSRYSDFYFDVKEAIEELNMYLEGKKNICYVTSQILQDFAQHHPYCTSTIAYFAKDYQATEYDYPTNKQRMTELHDGLKTMLLDMDLHDGKFNYWGFDENIMTSIIHSGLEMINRQEGIAAIEFPCPFAILKHIYNGTNIIRDEIFEQIKNAEQQECLELTC